MPYRLRKLLGLIGLLAIIGFTVIGLVKGIIIVAPLLWAHLVGVVSGLKVGDSGSITEASILGFLALWILIRAWRGRR